MTVFKLHQAVIITFIITFTITAESTNKNKEKSWPESYISSSRGHYPNLFCRISKVILDTKNKVFKYKKTNDENALKNTCHFSEDIWPLENVWLKNNNMSTPVCNLEFDSGYIFTMYYFYGSNYFHLHYDMMMPVYSAVYHTQFKQTEKIVFMPSVESKRLQMITWDTEAFNKPSYWMDMLEVLSGSQTLMPLDSNLASQGKTICLKSAYFGTPSIDIENRQFINSYIKFIKTRLKVPHNRINSTMIGIISRSNRRRILNENDLLEAVSKFAPVEMVEFAGQSFRHQVQSVQKYSVLVGVNGAGLTNAMFLPPGAVAVQLVPYNATVNYKTFQQILQSRGPYLEWHNKHARLTHESPHDMYRSSPDTTVHVEEFVSLMKQALSLVNSNRHTYDRKTEL